MKKWHRKAQRIACSNALTTTYNNYNKGDIKKETSNTHPQ